MPEPFFHLAALRWYFTDLLSGVSMPLPIVVPTTHWLAAPLTHGGKPLQIPATTTYFPTGLDHFLLSSIFAKIHVHTAASSAISVAPLTSPSSH